MYKTKKEAEKNGVRRDYNAKKDNYGITLISLIITIIILAILAGISISQLTSDNSIIQNATEAKTRMEEAQESERIKLAVMAAQMNSSGYAELNKENLQREIDKNFKNENSNIIENVDGTFTVYFVNTKREYNINSNGVELGVDWEEKMANAIEQNINGKKVYALDSNELLGILL